MKIILSLNSLFLCVVVNAQLQIGAGISWKSDAATYVVLNDLGLKYYASSTLFENKFKFTGSSDAKVILTMK